MEKSTLFSELLEVAVGKRFQEGVGLKTLSIKKLRLTAFVHLDLYNLYGRIVAMTSVVFSH